MKDFAKNFVKRKEFGIIMIVLVLSVILTFISDKFLTADNIIDILKSNAVIGIMAFGMLPVLISGGIDLSVSATIALSAVVIGNVMTVYTGISPILIILLGMLTGIVVGLVNGLIITKFKIAPIVATLGMMTIINGSVLWYTGGAWINNLPDKFKGFGHFKLIGIPSQILIFIIAGIVTALILKYTLIGRGIYAVGGSESSAVRVGYNVDKILIFTYAFSGMMAGLAAIVHVSITENVNPTTYVGYELDVISTTVLGGASVMGGVGTVFGTVLGVVLMAIIKNGLVLARVPNFWQQVFKGLIIIIAVSIDVINRKREQAKLVRVDVEE